MEYSLNKQIGSRVRMQRELLGITREKLCDYVSISPQFLSEVERGIKGVSAETLRKLCDGLGLSADYLLCGKETLTDISPIVAMLATLNKAYIPLAEDVLKTFFLAIALKEEKAQ